jgi:hypothetical protein
MFSKLFKMLLHETTNVADTTAVTFNTSGTYNPKYGKQKVYVTGRGGTGTTVPGNYFDNSYTNAGTYTPSTTNPVTTGLNAHANEYIVYSSYAYANSASPLGFYYYRGNEYAYTTWSTTYTTAPSPQYLYIYAASYNFTSGFNTTAQPSASSTTNNLSYYNEPVPGNINSASYTPGNYVAGNSGTYATNYTTGTAANILGITFPGGVGGVATVVPATAIANPKYGTATTITIPTGGYATITFTL